MAKHVMGFYNGVLLRSEFVNASNFLIEHVKFFFAKVANAGDEVDPSLFDATD